jgi:hypothetical protein
MTQQSLLDPPAPVPRPVEEFLAGFATRFAFGDKPTAEQKRAAARAAATMANVLAELRAAA